MKRALLLLFAIYLCSNSYAEEQTKTYTIRHGKSTYNKTIIICRGNFQNGILSDGPIRLWLIRSSRDNIFLEGTYRADSTNTFLGTYKVGTSPFDYHDLVLNCYGTIYNDKENRTISKKSSAKNWEIELQFRLFIGNDPKIKATPKSRFLFFSTKKNSTKSFWNYAIINNKIWDKPITATVCFPNECKYIGPIFYWNGSHSPGWYIGMNYKNDKFDYQYVWPNGDYFIGKIHGSGLTKDMNPLISQLNNSAYLVDSGCFHLVGGDTLNYKDYRRIYTVAEQDECLKHPYPSQLFPLLKERKQKEEAEKQRERKEEAFRRERERREEAFRRERERREEVIAQRERELIRKQNLINKYGSVYGTAIYNGKVELGMTVEMVQEIKGKGEVTRHVELGREIIVLTYGGYNALFQIFTKIRTYTFVNNRLTEYME